MPKSKPHRTRKLTHDQIRKTRIDPVWFAKNILSARPWKKQREILHALTKHRNIAVRSCNGSGKSHAAAIATLWWLMAFEDATVITTAPSNRQVKQILWREINSLYLRNKDIIQGKITQTQLDISPRRFAIGFTASSDVLFQGFHSPNLLVIVDEASEVRETIYDGVLSCLTSHNSKLLLIGNPTNQAGTFYDAFHDHRHFWHNIQISALDTPAFQQNSKDHEFLKNAKWHPLRENPEEPNGIATPEWAQNIANHHGEDSDTYRIRVLGQFPEPTKRRQRKNHSQFNASVPFAQRKRTRSEANAGDARDGTGFPPLAGEMAEGRRGPAAQPEPDPEPEPDIILTHSKSNPTYSSRYWYHR